MKFAKRERERVDRRENTFLVLKPDDRAIFPSIAHCSIKCLLYDNIHLHVGDVRSRYIGWSGSSSRCESDTVLG
jgi:hypothetical protein